MNAQSQKASDLVQRYQDLAVVEPGPGEVLHAGLANGAADGFFEPNTGGGVWLSHTLHAIDGQPMHVVAGSDSVGVYRATRPTAEACARAWTELCGEDRHLVLAEGGYRFPDAPAAQGKALDAIFSRFRERHGMPDRTAEQLLQLRPGMREHQWLVSYIQRRDGIVHDAQQVAAERSEVQSLPMHPHEVADDVVDRVLTLSCPGGGSVMAFLPMADARTASDAARAVVRTIVAHVTNSVLGNRRVAACVKACESYDTHGLERDGIKTLVSASHAVVLSVQTDNSADLDELVQDVQDAIVDLCEAEQPEPELEGMTPVAEDEPEGPRP